MNILELALVSKDRMTKVEALEAEIRKLSSAELVQLRDWLLQLDDAAWDRQIEQDASSGNLDKVFDKPLADHREGKSREL